MAEVVLDGADVVVRMSALERLAALRGDVRVPRSAVTSCRVSAHPRSELRGLRAPGTAVPGLFSLCTLRGADTRDFAAVYRGRPALVIDLHGAEFDRLVVSVKDEAIAEALAGELAGGARPG